MKISTSFSSIYSRFGDPFDSRQRLRAAGFRYFDLNFYDWLGDSQSRFFLPDWERQVDDMGNRLAKIGVAPIICHAPKGEPAKDRAGILARSQRALLCAGMLGIPDMVIHPGGLPGWTNDDFDRFNIEYIRELLPFAEKSGTRILVENVGRWDEQFYVQSGKELFDFVEKVNHPLVQACLDTGHLSLEDDDNPKAIRLLGKHLKGLHVQDNLGSLPIPVTDRAWRQDLHLPPGLGIIDFDATVRALVDVGYEGSFNLEIESPRCFGKQFIGCTLPRLAYMTPELVLEYYTIIYDSLVELLAANGVTVE